MKTIPDSSRTCPTLAIDGPSGAGKSTLARRVAETLGYLFLDTGAMYRAMALGLERRGWSGEFLARGEDAVGDPASLASAPTSDETSRSLDEPLTRRLAEVDVRLDAEGTILLDDQAVGEEIRTPEVTRLVSPISALPEVRERMVDLQRRAREDVASKGRFAGIVAEGRDVGTVVFPDASLKIFLEAGLRERARRRMEEEVKRGNVRTLEVVEAEIVERDRRDSERTHSPLRRAEDAVLIDSTSLSVEDLLAEVLRLSRSRH